MNTITKNKGKRDQTWDIVKGIGIVLVVIGHSGCPAYLKHFIYLFHMGLFFFISGMFLSNPNLNNLKHFIQKKINRLYIPFIVIGIILVLLHNILYHIGWNKLPYENTSIFYKKILGVLLFKDLEPLNTPLWFLKSLFCASIISFSILLIKKKWLQIVLIILLYSLGWICSKEKIHLFFSIERECVTIATFYMGYLLKDSINFLSKYSLLAVVILLLSSQFISIDTAIYKFSFYGAYLLYTLLGVIFVYSVSKRLIKTILGEMLSFCGKYSMDILIAHYAGMQILSQIIIYLNLQPNNVLWQVPTIYSLKETWWWIPYTLCGLGLSLIYIFIKNKIKSIYKK